MPTLEKDTKERILDTAGGAAQESRMRVGLRATAMLVALSAVAGCIGAPARKSLDIGVEPPAAWSVEPAVTLASGSDWWTAFGDAQLDALIETAIDENRDLYAAAARLDYAEAQARIAGADLAPSVGAGLSAARQRQSFIGLPIPGAGPVLSTTSTRFGLSLDTAWEVDLWGRLRAGVRAALAEAQAADADLAGARLSIAGQTAKTWFAVLEAAAQLRLARDSAESYRALADRIRSRYERGLRPPLELRLALSNLSAAEAQLATRRQQLDAAQRRLDVLLGRYPAAGGVSGDDAAELPALTAPVPALLPAELVARRPDLVAAERRVAAGDERFAAARRALYPRLALTTTGGTASDQLGDLLDGDFRVWSVVGNLVQPLFQGGRLRAGVDAARAGGDEALARYASLVLRAYAEVETALTAEQWLRQRAVHVDESAVQLTAASRLAEERYGAGVGDYLTVLESQTRAFTALSQALTVRRELLDNRIDLHLALGGGFELPDAKGLP